MEISCRCELSTFHVDIMWDPLMDKLRVVNTEPCRYAKVKHLVDSGNVAVVICTLQKVRARWGRVLWAERAGRESDSAQRQPGKCHVEGLQCSWLSPASPGGWDDCLNSPCKTSLSYVYKNAITLRMLVSFKCHVTNRPTCYSDFHHIWSFTTDCHRSRQYQISRKSIQWEPRWYMRTDGHDGGIGAFRDYIVAPKNETNFLCPV